MGQKIKKDAKVARAVLSSKSGGHKRRAFRTKAIIYTASGFGVTALPFADGRAFFFLFFF
jgi:hypothetical protein